MSIVLVLDCGATNIRAIAVDAKGEIIASHFIKNETEVDGSNSNFYIWNFDCIWNKLLTCAQQVIEKVKNQKILAITVTTFGVDGAPFDSDGNQIYPIISWKCPRTLPVMNKVEKEIDRIKLYLDNGTGDYSFNTLYKLRWLQEYKSDIYKKMDKFIFISSMITYKLTDVMTTDYTMAGTSMLANLKNSHWNKSTLAYLNLTTDHFPPMVMAGEHIGTITAEIANTLKLDPKTPVISAGHDTQLALIGSGAKENQAFLSSGTWEILMARSQLPNLNKQALKNGVTVELDAVKGLYNPAIQWLSSAVIEWVIEQFYHTEKYSNNSDLYSILIDEAEKAGDDAGGVIFEPTLSIDKNGIGQGSITGLSIHTTRGQICRAVFNALSLKLKEQFSYLNNLCQLANDPIVIVGGGTKNKLWNQIRANSLQRPLHIVKQTEATVIGAAMFAFYGVNYYQSIDEAQSKMKPDLDEVIPLSIGEKACLKESTQQ